MPELMSLRSGTTTINIIQRIGVNYSQFGIFLLDDSMGDKVDVIAHKHMRNAVEINREILREWLAGRGQQPVTWRTLVDVLNTIGLRTLASEIEAVKC